MAFSLRMVCSPDCSDEIIPIDDDAIGINLYSLAKHAPSDMARRVQEVRLRYKPLNADCQQAILLDRSTFWLAEYIGDHIHRPELTDSVLSNVRHAVAMLISSFHDQAHTTYPDHWANVDFKTTGVIRYGNVELRVLENFLTDKAKLRQAVSSICAANGNEKFMYQEGQASNFLAANDMEFNLRHLMTNAGMYIGTNPQASWDCIEFWCNSYATAIKQLPLACFPHAYPFFFNVQRSIWEETGIKKTYVEHPTIFDFYRFAEGRKLLVVSPLATIILRQVESSNTCNLLKSMVLPPFDVETIEAPISTFPNRPHGSWLESFRALTDQIDSSFAKHPSAAFAASCGAYGLPLCDYVARKYSVPVFYVGNILHAYFGILQNATLNFMVDDRNEVAWTRGNLGKFPNFDRIDGGRYI